MTVYEMYIEKLAQSMAPTTPPKLRHKSQTLPPLKFKKDEPPPASKQLKKTTLVPGYDALHPGK